MFLDGSGRLNLLARISQLSWDEFRHQASLAQDYFKETLEDTFDALFLKKQSPFLKYDNTIVLVFLFFFSFFFLFSFSFLLHSCY